MATHGFPEGQGRETRLLFLIVAVSIAVLLLLARLRFPSAALTVATPAPGPLAGLAGRAAFDELSETMNSVLARVSPRLVGVELDAVSSAGVHPQSGARSPDPRDKRSNNTQPGGPTRLSMALRVRPDLLLLYVPPQWHPHRFIDSDAAIEVVAEDPKRQLALLRAPGAAAEFRAEQGADAFSGLSYVAMLEATRGGPTIQPVFIGRVAPVVDELWPGALYAVTSASALPPGVFVFSIEGRLIGLTLREQDNDVLVPGAVLDQVATQLGAGGAVER